MDLALAQILQEQSLTKERLHQWNQSLKAQLDWFEASAFPLEETSSTAVYDNAKPYNLYSHTLLALDLGGKRSLQTPRQWLRNLQGQPPTSRACDHHQDEVGQISSQKDHHAKGIDVVVQTIGHEATAEKNALSNEGVGNQLTPDANHDQRREGILSDPEEVGQERATSSEAAIKTQKEIRMEGETRRDGEKEGQRNEENVAESPPNTPKSIGATSTSSLRHTELIVDESQSRKRMKLRSDTKADLATSDASRDEASESEADTSLVSGSRKRRKRRSKKQDWIENMPDTDKRPKLAPKRRGQINEVSEMAERFASIEMQERFRTTRRESHNEDQYHVLSAVPREQLSRTITSMDPQQFIRGLSMYRREVEGTLVGEKVCRDRYRITLAHFSDDYELAQSNSTLFLQWTEHLVADLDLSTRRETKSRRSSSLVMDRIVDIIFPKAHRDSVVEVDDGERSSKLRADARKRDAHTVQDWLRLGKPWSQIFKQHGYGVLRFVPPEFSDEL